MKRLFLLIAAVATFSQGAFSADLEDLIPADVGAVLTLKDFEKAIHAFDLYMTRADREDMEVFLSFIDDSRESMFCLMYSEEIDVEKDIVVVLPTAYSESEFVALMKENSTTFQSSGDIYTDGDACIDVFEDGGNYVVITAKRSTLNNYLDSERISSSGGDLTEVLDDYGDNPLLFYISGAYYRQATEAIKEIAAEESGGGLDSLMTDSLEAFLKKYDTTGDVEYYFGYLDSTLRPFNLYFSAVMSDVSSAEDILSFDRAGELSYLPDSPSAYFEININTDFVVEALLTFGLSEQTGISAQQMNEFSQALSGNIAAAAYSIPGYVMNGAQNMPQVIGVVGLTDSDFVESMFKVMVPAQSVMMENKSCYLIFLEAQMAVYAYFSEDALVVATTQSAMASYLKNLNSGTTGFAADLEDMPDSGGELSSAFYLDGDLIDLLPMLTGTPVPVSFESLYFLGDVNFDESTINLQISVE